MVVILQEALQMGTSDGRYGYGNIYVFASGNGGQMNDNCNFDGYANSIYTLTVGKTLTLERNTNSGYLIWTVALTVGT